MGDDKVRIIFSDKIIQAYLEPLKGSPIIYSDRNYYWYSANQIFITQGGFEGRVLNGKYIEYYLDKSLKTQGYFKNGLKDGIWKNWNQNSKLTDIINWENGFKYGKYKLFDDSGKLVEEGSFRRNFLHGWNKKYLKKDSISTHNYHRGRIVKKTIKD